MHMKRVFYIISVLLLVAACNKEGSPAQVVETLSVSSPDATRVHLVDGVNAVWNAGDKVSVFYNGGDNECWNYTGNDGAFKGTISHEGNTWRVGNGRFTALYPYDSSASISGEVISTTVPAVQQWDPLSYSWALLVSSTDDASLQFSYACSFVRLSLSGLGTIKSITLKGGNNEPLAGPATLDISGSSIQSAYGSGTTKEITVKNADGSILTTLGDVESDFWIGLLPGTFSKGLVLTATLESGNSEDINVSGPAVLKAGEVFCVHARMFGTETITIDFVNRASSFSPLLPSTGNLSTSDGTHTYDSGNGTYTLTFHPGYDANWYGYGFYDHTDFGRSLLLGRKGGWIKLPVLTGYALLEAEYTSGSLSGHPFLSDNPSDPFNHMLSNQIGDTTGNTNYNMMLDNPVKNKQYYLVVGSGNLLMKKLILRYVKKD